MMPERTYVAAAEQNRSSEPEIFRSELDEDPEYREQRREFLDRFLGNRQGSVSAAAYKRALAEARALPPSPLLGGQTFRSQKRLERWHRGPLP